MALLSLRNVTVGYGGHPLLDDVELHIERGDRICLLGINGAGKSTLLRLLAGESRPDTGQVIHSASLRVSRLPQQVPSHLEGPVRDIVRPGDDSENLPNAHLEAEQILTRLQLDPDASFATLSGGTRRRVLLARALIGNPDIVLLDEPTNHLDIDSVAWLEEFLLRTCRTFLFVTHDRSFLRRLASRVIELDRGRLSDWHCDYDTFLRRKEESLHDELRQQEALDKRLAKEEAWRRQGVRARTVRNQGRLRALEALRVERRQRRERSGAVNLSIQEADRTGQIVLKTQHITCGFGDQSLIRDFTTVIMRGDRVGILGPNGCGKTTLLRLLLEPEAPVDGSFHRTGTVSHGTNLQIAYADQLRARLEENLSLADNIANGREFVMINGLRRHIIGYLGDFLFPPDRARQPVSSLSGGERNRLLLARLFAQPSNLLVLDEPTNDLDLDTLELLEEQLAAYTGTVLVVSHDRAFLNNVVTGILAFEPHPPGRSDPWLEPGQGWYINEYAGGYDDWARSRLRPLAPAPVSVSTRAPARTVAPPARKRLNERERRELAVLPGRIEALEEEQAQWQGRMADPSFYRQSGDSIARARERSAEIATELEAAYRRWEELEARGEPGG
ncbi:MAG: ABC transporter ATP-binding protein [Lentisphaerae bacterium RIFOXYC12_FULL_60_16]|nr:MAG: ABC transporter ATP-binding protein [Lentisphaerae bacterium RIFOXYC12_FULL_60_16]OGV78276.1 MAG: ABC transporter ATP-binding protein [Lentisphaerae bacterium RIFOXYB12_FULL_60_10]